MHELAVGRRTFFVQRHRLRLPSRRLAVLAANLLLHGRRRKRRRERPEASSSAVCVNPLQLLEATEEPNDGAHAHHLEPKYDAAPSEGRLSGRADTSATLLFVESDAPAKEEPQSREREAEKHHHGNCALHQPPLVPQLCPDFLCGRTTGVSKSSTAEGGGGCAPKRKAMSRNTHCARLSISAQLAARRPNRVRTGCFSCCAEYMSKIADSVTAEPRG